MQHLEDISSNDSVINSPKVQVQFRRESYVPDTFLPVPLSIRGGPIDVRKPLITALSPLEHVGKMLLVAMGFVRGMFILDMDFQSVNNS
jgi:hypothetical protein